MCKGRAEVEEPVNEPERSVRGNGRGPRSVPEIRKGKDLEQKRPLESDQ